MHYVIQLVLVALVNIQHSLHCKQGSLQETSFYNFLCYNYTTESTTKV